MKSLFNSSYAINIGDVDFVHLIQYSPDFVLRVFILELWKPTTECSLHMRAGIGAFNHILKKGIEKLFEILQGLLVSSSPLIYLSNHYLYWFRFLNVYFILKTIIQYCYLFWGSSCLIIGHWKLLLLASVSLGCIPIIMNCFYLALSYFLIPLGSPGYGDVLHARTLKFLIQLWVVCEL